MAPAQRAQDVDGVADLPDGVREGRAGRGRGRSEETAGERGIEEDAGGVATLVSSRHKWPSGTFNAARTARGLRLITFRRTSAGPVGLRSPRSQCRSVASETPKMAANDCCFKPMRLRNTTTSTGTATRRRAFP